MREAEILYAKNVILARRKKVTYSAMSKVQGCKEVAALLGLTVCSATSLAEEIPTARFPGPYVAGMLAGVSLKDTIVVGLK